MKTVLTSPATAPAPVAALPQAGSPEVFQLTREKETSNSVRFTEVVPEGQPPVFGGLYLPKWKVNAAGGVAIVLLSGPNAAAPANAAHVATLTPSKETPNKVVFTEQPQPGTAPVFGAVYLPKWKFGKSQSVTLALVLG